MGSYEPGSSVTDVEVSGHLAFACSSSSGVLILDVSNPSSPTLVGRYDPQGVSDFCTSGSFVYVVHADHLEIFDADNPSSPGFLGTCHGLDSAWGVALSGNSVCVAEGGGIAVIDVSSPTQPVLVGSYHPLEYIGPESCFAVYERLVYVGYMSAFEVGGVVRIIDIITPSQPVLAASYYQPFWAKDIFVADRTAYLTDWAGMSIIDVSNPEIPLVRSLAHRGHWINGHNVYVAERVAYMTCGWQDATPCGLKIMDMSDPSSPALLTFYADPDGAYYGSLFVSGSHAFISKASPFSDELLAVDVSDPSSPTALCSYPLSGWCQDMVAHDRFVYLAVEPAGLLIFDVSAPSSPTLQGQWTAGPTTASANAVQVRGSLACLTWGTWDDNMGGLYLLDIADASSPVLVGSFETLGSAMDISLSGDLAYVTTHIGPMGRGNLHVIDIRSPAKPRLQATYETLCFSDGVWADGRVVYLCQSDWDWPECTQFLVLEYTPPTSTRHWLMY